MSAYRAMDSEAAWASFTEQLVNDSRIANAARAFVTAEARMEGDPNPDKGVVIACMAAHHDMRLLCGFPCGCDEGTCPGLLS